MVKINPNFLKLQGNYLFAEIARFVKEYTEANPDKKVIKLGIGDVTEPLNPTVIAGLNEGVAEMSRRETFQGYPPYEGFDFVREAIAKNDFADRGINISKDEIFVSTGAKEDTANFQELFSTDMRIAITDPVYPVYLDTNVMSGRGGDFANGRYTNVTYLDCNAENNFIPAIPTGKVDIIYLCFPNNPTGQVATKAQLTKWVEYAKANNALILFDAAYEAFIREPDIPHSIFEIPGARECAVEFRSLSKTAGFTGTRFAYTIIPNDVMITDETGAKHQLNKIWVRRQATKFNGVSYIIQKGAAAVFTSEGQIQVKKTIDYYLENTKIIGAGLSKLGISYTGGKNSPYIWLKTPNNMGSWEFFHKLLNEANVVGTPGVGFGKCGEGYFRLTGFGARANIEEAMERFAKLKF
ncbi:MAG: LL-diaminopimelate aminotransferase [Spirochaetales bacterium]|nr:LL-diaminopimelate aminotransferase [Spirochaetales bacterium]